MLTTSPTHAIDRFPLVDVGIVAQMILEECVAISKFALGGVGFVGNGRGYFVAVNGPVPEGG